MKLLLLVQSESDVSHLDSAARAILNSSITGVWVVFSPAITVNASEAAAKLDAEISQLKTAERAAADRSDYEAAKGYKAQREGKELDRAKALRDAWKTAPVEERQAKTKTIFAPLMERLKTAGLNVRITSHSDHYDREQWVAMLNSLSGVWFKEFVPGSFLVAWPEAVETAMKLQQAVPAPSSEISVPQMTEMLQPGTFPKGAGNAVQPTRRQELEAMHRHDLQSTARKLNLNAGKKTPELIEDILAAEQKTAAAEPALAEY